MKSAEFRWGQAMLPYDPELIATPINSIIGGASLWTMTAPDRTAGRIQGRRRSSCSSSRNPEIAADLAPEHRLCAGDARRATSCRRSRATTSKNPGADLPIQQLTRGTSPTIRKGLRLGRLPEIRNIIQEELEKALQGSRPRSGDGQRGGARQPGAARLREIGADLTRPLTAAPRRWNVARSFPGRLLPVALVAAAAAADGRLLPVAGRRRRSGRA